MSPTLARSVNCASSRVSASAVVLTSCLSSSAASAARSSGSFALTSFGQRFHFGLLFGGAGLDAEQFIQFSDGILKVLLESAVRSSYRCLLCSCFLDLAARLTPGENQSTNVKRAIQVVGEICEEPQHQPLYTPNTVDDVIE